MSKQSSILKNIGKAVSRQWSKPIVPHQPFLYSLLVLLFLCSVFWPLSSLAEDKALDTKGTIVITSATLTADNKAHTALFEGSVVAKTENMTLHSDKMLVYHAGDTGKVTRIDAEGRVKLIKGERVITSRAATYFAEDEKIIFTGEPMAVEKGSVVTGTKMIYLMKEDRSIVENSKVFLENKKGK